MKITPTRFGGAAVAPVSANIGSDSSHGRAMVTPAPRSTVRREMAEADLRRLDMSFTFRRGWCSTFIAELWTGYDGLDHRMEAVAIGGERGAHLIDQRLVGEQQRAAERVDEQLAAHVVEKVVLAAFANVGLDAFEA